MLDRVAIDTSKGGVNGGTSTSAGCDFADNEPNTGLEDEKVCRGYRSLDTGLNW